MFNFGSFAGFADHIGRISAKMGVGHHAALERGAIIVETEAKAILGHYQPGWEGLHELTKKQRVEKGYTPDDPLLRSGELRDSIKHEIGWMTARVFSDSPIAAAQELGTSRIPPRPFLQTAAIRKEAEVAHAVGRATAALLSGDSVEIVASPNR